MSQRQILGPSRTTERSGQQILRDIRPFGTKIGELLQSSFSGFLMIGGAILVGFLPVATDPVLLIALLLCLWAFSHPTVLPMQRPAHGAGRDRNNPSPKDRKPQPSAGIFYLGTDEQTGQQVWVSNAWCRQHAIIPGTTGAGKTTTMISLLVNALIYGSGFIFVDGKADNDLYARIYTLARRFGREDDVLALNFLVASGNKDTNTFNPFASCNADVLRELLVSQIERNPQGGASDSNGVFRDRAIAMLGALAPALVWLRDNRSITVDIDRIRFATELRSIYALAVHRRFRMRKSDGTITEVDLDTEPAIPEEYLYPLKSYLGETGFNDLEDGKVTLDEVLKKSDEPSKQHLFALMHFTHTFTQLAVSLGHIFKVQTGDIDIRDVVLNRRILIVNLPALENSGETTQALGKIVVATLRNAMAQTLGANLEGDYSEIVENNIATAPTPSFVVLDEVGYYASPGLDKMLAMGRGLGFSFWLAMQEFARLHAVMGESALSLLGNANLQILTRLQEGSRTRDYIEKTAGDTYAVEATRYDGDGVGAYRESASVEARRVSRVNWNDMIGLLEGEAIILYGRHRVYTKLFHVDPKPGGALRINRPVSLPAPDRHGLRQGSGRVDRAIDALISLADLPDPGETPRRTRIIAAIADAARASADVAEDGILLALEAALDRLPAEDRADASLYACFDVLDRAGLPETQAARVPRFAAAQVARGMPSEFTGALKMGASPDVTADRWWVSIIAREETRIETLLDPIDLSTYLRLLEGVIARIETFQSVRTSSSSERDTPPPDGSIEDTETGDRDKEGDDSSDRDVAMPPTADMVGPVAVQARLVPADQPRPQIPAVQPVADDRSLSAPAHADAQGTLAIPEPHSRRSPASRPANS